MKFKKSIIATAIVSIVIGSLCIGVSLAMGGSLNALRISFGITSQGFQFHQYGSSVREDIVLQDIDSLTVSINMGNIEIVETDTDEIHVYDLIEDRYSVEMRGKKAVLNVKDEHQMWFFNFGSQESLNIRIEVPKGFQFQSLEIDNSMGEINIQNIQAETLRIEDNMGDITGYNIKSNELTVDNDMGDIELEGIFLNKTTIEASMGNIDITVRDDIRKYSYDADCSLGSVEVNDEKGRSSQIADTKNDIRIKNAMGDIRLNFN